MSSDPQADFERLHPKVIAMTTLEAGAGAVAWYKTGNPAYALGAGVAAILTFAVAYTRATVRLGQS